MKASELRVKTAGDLEQELLSLTKAQFGLRMQVATQQLSNNSQLLKVRRDMGTRHQTFDFRHLEADLSVA